jgi:NADH-quinone oxidoreductase subunit M
MDRIFFLQSLVLIPFLGFLIVLLGSRNGRTAKWMTGSILFICLMIVGGLLALFRTETYTLQFFSSLNWIGAWGIRLSLALDGLNALLVLLTPFVALLSVLGTSTSKERPRLHFSMILLLVAALQGCFLSQNLLVFFIFWEAALIPMFILIAAYGGAKRFRAAMKFLLYTALGSILMLTAVLMMGYLNFQGSGVWSFEYAVLLGLEIPVPVQVFLFVAFALAFAIKCPLFPFHGWMPDVYEETPADSLMLLTGVFSKLGTYGFLKIAIPMFPLVAAKASPLICMLAVVGIVYGAMMALVQSRMRTLAAYSSISHIGYIVLGLFSFHPISQQGAILQMVSHAVVVSALLFLIQGLEERQQSDEMARFGGIAAVVPGISTVFMVAVLASIALPTTSGFAAEFLILFGVFQHAFQLWEKGAGIFFLILTVMATTGVVLGAVYMLRMAQAVLFGPKPSRKEPMVDLRIREYALLIPAVLVIFGLGLFPGKALNTTEKGAEWVVSRVHDCAVLGQCQTRDLMEK